MTKHINKEGTMYESELNRRELLDRVQREIALDKAVDEMFDDALDHESSQIDDPQVAADTAAEAVRALVEEFLGRDVRIYVEITNEALAHEQ